MDGNKFCTQCGAMNRSNSQFCTNCGCRFVQNNNNIQEKNNESDATKLGIISLILYFGAPAIITTLLGMFSLGAAAKLSVLYGLCPLAGIIVMIIGRVKYPKNKFLKIVMWVIIGPIILGLILFVLLMLWCEANCRC